MVTHFINTSASAPQNNEKYALIGCRNNTSYDGLTEMSVH